MASGSLNLRMILLLSAFLVSFQPFMVTSFQYEVGGKEGWVVPANNDTEMFNEWASKNRFKVGDTINFVYKNDSVMIVSDSDYQNCNSSLPLYFSNNEDTVYKLDRPGFFYFISGTAGHCERGQRMIIKVLSPSPPESSPEAPSKATSISATPAVAAVSLFVLFFGFNSV